MSPFDSADTEDVFDPRGYWEDRLLRRYTLGGVGFLGLSDTYNAWMYRVRRRVFLREIARLFASPQSLEVLDIGSGTGFYVDRWHEVGVAAVTGSDVTEVAVRNLERRYPGDRFVRFDAGGDQLGDVTTTRFDVISAMDVLYHIVDDTRFSRAFENAFELLKPNGHLVFTDNFIHGETVRLRHQAIRPLSEIESILTATGFEILRRRPVFFLMNAPVDSTSRVHDRWWWVVRQLTQRHDRVGQALGATLYPLELALVAYLREGSSTELMICRRPSTRGSSRGSALAS